MEISNLRIHGHDLLTYIGSIRRLPGVNYRRRLPHTDNSTRRANNGQVRDMGHSGAGAVQVARTHVLPERQLRSRRL